MYRIMLSLLILTACASLTENQCRADSDDWVALGEYRLRDGRPAIEAYESYCERYSAEVDHDAYLKGWDTGHANSTGAQTRPTRK